MWGDSGTSPADREESVALKYSNLRSFVALAAELNFGRAALHVHVTQSALSRHIQQLESNLGFNLLIRNTRNVQLTKQGEEFLTYARRAVAASEAATNQARRIRNGELGTIRIAYMELAALGEMPRIVHSFRKKYADVDIQINEVPSTKQISQILEDDVDIGFLIPVGTVEGLEYRPVQQDELSVVLHEDHALSRQSRIAASDLRDEVLLLGNREAWLPFRRAIEHWFHSRGIHPVEGQEAYSGYALLGLVGAGMGYTLHSSRLVKQLPQRVTMRHFQDEGPIIETVLAWNKNQTSKPVLNFIETALQVLQNTGEPTDGEQLRANEGKDGR